MSLTPDNIVHQNSGGTSTSNTSTAITVSLPGGETTNSTDSTVFVGLFGSDGTFAVGIPAGWDWVGRPPVSPARRMFHAWPDAGHSGWRVVVELHPSATGGGPVAWVVTEIENVQPTELGSPSGTAFGATTGTTLAITAPSYNAYDFMVLAFHGAVDSTDTTASLWGSHTNGFTEVLEATQAGASKSTSLSMSALGNLTTPGAYGTTATLDRTMTTNDYGHAAAVAILAKGAKTVPNVSYVDGAEHGTAVGNTLCLANFKLLDTATANVAVSATAARSGGFGWLLSSTAAACNFTQSMYAFGTAFNWPEVNRRHWCFETLPGVNVTLLTLSTTGGTAIVLRYITASQKLGLKVGAGTEIVSDDVTSPTSGSGLTWTAT